jgi:hypothetical protein
MGILPEGQNDPHLYHFTSTLYNGSQQQANHEAYLNGRQGETGYKGVAMEDDGNKKRS